ncbi:cytochrome ubiquinol oxidase subunit I [Bordetella bronchiseptica]|uniref:cytochrome ubiquinol oxidase subunit I n=1 Tax=Bordetella bronchiseptica TaxID=518 RepID=UPI0002903955|nr:cytochrome ubiquinol oxidase subunit I [Bordetella bronchiseptica]AZW11605.1 cytochrome ubiquinol oxidase subunit I [Bordetella bronchiseptica]KAB1445286.1 cytochrome ubiquinol oxidase subunit I [Bordetella bronchiseptica]KAB1571649.1 cytochrome ubiquinol oxidase subunit I [Bordetella bronchiseptica]KDC48837.1 cytochrome ubiquinol oxidase [Bordetella bronchiseptica M85/00/2]KDC66286.1 cytochrome ubiquinol oxidase [Bordetella bronchiseptica MBORD624]
MMSSEALLLARIQFGFTISFHIIFPAITIGLASYLAVLEGCWLRTRDTVYRDLYHFWSKVFAVNFGMGVVSGLVMAYQFGTNWSAFSEFAGSITGPLLAYEVLTAFFLEAGFLGVMLFGWSRVGPRLHFFSTIMVALGTLVSATWILASNSWMQTPAGYEIVDGRVVPVDWLAVIFNPSFPYRLAHMGIAAFLATALLVAASGAWHLLRGHRTPAVRRMFAMALGMLAIAAPLQAVVGDMHGINTLKHQPAKIAAIEGHWENVPGEGVPLHLFGVPDMQAETTRYALSVPRLGSLILTHSLDGQFPGLKSYPPADRPNATVVFWSFRVMVGLGLLAIALAAWAGWARLRGRLYDSRALQRFALAMGPSGLVAILAGWYTTEIGRQPWIVQGLMRTADAATPHGVPALTLTLLLFVFVYLIVFGAGIAYVLRLIARGPSGSAPAGGEPGLVQRPLAAAQQGGL